jgi:hypothetical protein
VNELYNPPPAPEPPVPPVVLPEALLAVPPLLPFAPFALMLPLPAIVCAKIHARPPSAPPAAPLPPFAPADPAVPPLPCVLTTIAPVPVKVRVPLTQMTLPLPIVRVTPVFTVRLVRFFTTTPQSVFVLIVEDPSLPFPNGYLYIATFKSALYTGLCPYVNGNTPTIVHQSSISSQAVVISSSSGCSTPRASLL